jgi:type I restriction enzyme, S subunit
MVENNIPKHWQIKKLGEVCQTTSGGTPSRGNKSYYEGTIPWVKSGELDRGLILDTEEKISEEAVKNSSAKVFPKGTLLIALYGATIGKLAFLGVDAATNQAVCGIYKNENIDSNYLYHFLFSKKPSLVKQGIGGAQPNISQRILKNLDIPIPPLPEQLAIVSKIEELLSDLENGKQELLTAQQQLKVYRQSLLKAAFEGRLTDKVMKNGELPEGWKWVRLGDTCNKIQDGSHFSPQVQYDESGQNRFMYITAKNIRNDYMDFRKLIYVDKDFHDSIYSRCNPEYGDVLLTKDGVNTGEVTLNTILEPFSLLSSVCILKTKKEILLSSFLKYFIQSPFGNQAIIDSMTGTAIKRIVLRKIKDAQIILPKLEEQQHIVDELESKLTVCDKIEETISQSLLQAETLKQSILKKAFEGKLVKPQQTKIVTKPKNEYFYQMQLLALIAKASKQHSIEHGEMTLAKYAYLLDKVYGIPTYYDYNRWHLGPYPPEMKKAINNKQYFARKANHIVVVNEDKLLKYTNSYEIDVIDAVNDLASIFEKYSVKERADKTELLATVSKVVEDIKTSDITEVRKSMQDWKIELDNCPFKNKAEKFSIEETEECLKFLVQRGWIAKLINKN